MCHPVEFLPKFSFFSIVQIPAQMFLTLWKRRQSILQWEWDLGAETEDNDEMRPEWDDGYLLRLQFLNLGLGWTFNRVTQKVFSRLRELEVEARNLRKIHFSWHSVQVRDGSEDDAAQPHQPEEGALRQWQAEGEVWLQLVMKMHGCLKSSIYLELSSIFLNQRSL